MKEYNFIYNIEESDKELFFGPLNNNDPNDSFINIKEHCTIANIVNEAGIFDSVTQARKNGFNYEIPKGFSDRYLTKRKIRITILNIEG